MARKQRINKTKLQQTIWNMTDEQRMNQLANFQIKFYEGDNLSELLFDTVKSEKWMADKVLKSAETGL